eukprot:g5047.t1
MNLSGEEMEESRGLLNSGVEIANGDQGSMESERDERLRRAKMQPRLRKKFEYLLSLQQRQDSLKDKKGSENELLRLEPQSDYSISSTQLSKSSLDKLNAFVWKSYHPGGLPIDAELLPELEEKLEQRVEVTDAQNLSFDEFWDYFESACDHVILKRQIKGSTLNDSSDKFISRRLVTNGTHASHSENSHDKWYYRDPSGKIQGPFESSRMLAWFRRGQLPASLPVRRGSKDGCFHPLSKLGHRPFESSHENCHSHHSHHSHCNHHHHHHHHHHRESYTGCEALLASVGYSISAALMLVINKISVSAIPSASFVLSVQLLFTAFVVRSLSICGFLRKGAEGLQWRKVKRFIYVPILFTICVYSNMKALSVVNMETVIVFRCLAPAAVALMETLFLQARFPSFRVWLTMFMIACGGFLYQVTDKLEYGKHVQDGHSQKHTSANDQSLETIVDNWISLHGAASMPYFWPTIYLISICIEMTFVKHAINTIEMTTWTRVYYTNILALPMTILPGFLLKEFDDLVDFNFSGLSILLIVSSCVVAVAISFTGFHARKILSATAFTVLGVCNKVGAEMINVSLWSLHANAAGIFSLFLSIIGASLFAHFRRKENLLESGGHKKIPV